MVKILICDDHALVREGLRAVIAEMPKMAVVAEAKTGEEVLPLIRSHHIDVVLLDLNLPKQSGLETLLQLKRHDPNLRVLVVSAHAEEHYAPPVLKAGAHGYLSKTSSVEEIKTAIH